MNGMIITLEMFFQIMNLGMAVVTGCYAVIRAGFHNLLEFQAAILPASIRITGLEKSATAAATKIIGSVGGHVDKIFFTHHGFDYEPEVLGNGISQRFSHQLAGILDCKFHTQIPVPVRRDVEFSLPNPLSIVFNDAPDFKIVFDVELF